MLPKTLYSYLPKVLYCYLPITLQLVLNGNEQFKAIYEMNKWDKININNHSNTFIAFNVNKYHQTPPNKQNELIKGNPALTLQIYLVKYSQHVPDSDLWQAYQYECTQANREDLIRP